MITPLLAALRPVLGLCAIALALAALPALAQSPEIAAIDGALTVDLGGHRITMPAPPWMVASDKPVAQAQTRYTELAPGVESLVLMPTTVTVITWTELMGILAVNQPGYRAGTQLMSIVDPFSEACSDGQLEASSFGAVEAGVLLLLCGRYKIIEAEAPKRCGGGIILARVLESNAGAAKIYYEWCTPPFSLSDDSSWPVSRNTLAGYAAELAATAAFLPLPAPAAATE